MKILSYSYFLLISIVLISCTNPSPQSNGDAGDSDVAQLPEGSVLEIYDEVPGLATATVTKGEVVTFEGDLLEGKKHGTWTEYDSKGLITRLMTFDRGKRQGVELTFGRTGYVETKAKYVNDQLHGDYKLYNRRVVTEVRTYNQGKLHGVVKKFYMSGDLMQEAPYVDGQMHGIAKWYDEEGNLSLAYKYENGELVDKNPDLD